MIKNDIKYEIKNALPPNYAMILAHFGEQANFHKGTVFTYGDTIYAKDPLPEHLLIHELVHIKQQQMHGPEYWWKRYIDSAEFRLSQEVEAYRAQYQFILKTMPKRKQWNLLNDLALALSTKYRLDIGIIKATSLIRGHDE